MGQPIPSQHPAVVLRSHYTHLRALLAIALACVVSLAIAVVILAGEDGAGNSRPPAADGRSDSARLEGPSPSYGDVRDIAPAVTGRRYDGGPEEGTRGVIAPRLTTTRYDGGPEEGTRGR
jgi:hypothetical protein